MVGLEWDGPGVLLMASDKLDKAQLDYEAQKVYEFADIEDMRRRFGPSLALTVTIDDGRSFVVIAAETYGEAIRALFGQWTPDGVPLALESPARELTP